MEKKPIHKAIKEKIDDLSIRVCSDPNIFIALEFVTIGAMLFLLDIAS